MPGLTLITGGPASGKTARLIELLADRYAADPFAQTLVLVPTEEGLRRTFAYLQERR